MNPSKLEGKIKTTYLVATMSIDNDAIFDVLALPDLNKKEELMVTKLIIKTLKNIIKKGEIMGKKLSEKRLKNYKSELDWFKNRLEELKKDK